MICHVRRGSIPPAAEPRDKWRAFLGAVSSSGFIAGLVLGGVLTELAGWRSIFFVNIPAGGAVMLLAPFLIKESERLR
jgi:MFS family permease